MISINNHITTVLSVTGTTINNLVGENIYSVVIPDDILNPILVLERNLKINSTKDGISSYDCELKITVLSNTYEESIELAESVKNILVGYRDSNIMYSMLTDVEESYNSETFIQRLTFQIVTVE
jgi:hypothetical protein